MGISGSASAHLTRTDVVALWRCLMSTPAQYRRESRTAPFESLSY